MSGAACSAPAVLTLSTAPSDPFSEEPVCAGNVANDNHRDTLEASSVLGPECCVAVCPASALEDFVQSRNEVSTTSKLAGSAACSTSALVTFNTAPSHPLSVESVYDENVAIDNHKDTLEVSSVLGPECSVVACPTPVFEDFHERYNRQAGNGLPLGNIRVPCTVPSCACIE